MTNRRHMGWVAGAATLLSAAPLSLIFDSWTWLGQSLLVVALIAGVATLVRWLRGPLWAQLAAMAGTLLLSLTWFYPSGEEFAALLPTPDTLASFGSLLNTAVLEMRTYSVPVPDRRGLLFLAVLGVGGVAVLVDLLAVSLRRPALAGLPMLAIYSVPVAVYPDSVPPVPFMIGAIGFLWLLVADNVDRVRRFGRRFTGDGRDVDVWEPSPLAAAGRRLAVVGVVLAVLVPLAVPGMGSGLLTTLGVGAGEGPGAGGRRGGPVDLFAELSGRLANNKVEQMVIVTTNQPAPFYLRFATAERASADGFSGRRFRGQPVNRGLPNDLPNGDGIRRQTYRASIEIKPAFDMQMLPVYGTPTRVEGIDNTWLYDRDAQVIHSYRSLAAKKKYEFDYVDTDFDVEALRRSPPVPANSPLKDLARPPDDVKEVAEQVKTLIKGKTSEYDKVRAIKDFFKQVNGFSYSLETAPGTSGSRMVDFLQKKRGFCEQYAAAMAWMVRQAGIPSRVAFGFSNGSDKDGNTYTLTNKNMHAWTEVYFEGFGWVPFDATPSAGVPGYVAPPWAPDPEDTPETGPSSDPSGGAPLPSGASRGPNPDRFEDQLAGGPVPEIAPARPLWHWWLAGGIAAAVALLAMPALLRLLLRRRRRSRLGGADAPVAVAAADGTGPPGDIRVLPGTDPGAVRARADAHAAWEELLDMLVDYRVPVDPAETPRATAERLAGVAGMPAPAGEGARVLGRAEERARYARDPLRDTQLGGALKSVRRALAARSRRRTRITAVLMPPSVLLRWRLAMVEAGTGTVLAFSRMRETLLKLSPRRALANRVGR